MRFRLAYIYVLVPLAFGCSDPGGSPGDASSTTQADASTGGPAPDSTTSSTTSPEGSTSSSASSSPDSSSSDSTGCPAPSLESGDPRSITAGACGYASYFDDVCGEQPIVEEICAEPLDGGPPICVMTSSETGAYCLELASGQYWLCADGECNCGLDVVADEVDMAYFIREYTPGGQGEWTGCEEVSAGSSTSEGSGSGSTG